MGLATRVQFFSLTLIIGLLFLAQGCSRKPTVKPAPIAPAKVEMVPSESELATITLTPDAETRLGISTVASELRSVKQMRTFGGDVIIPSGKSIMISAPIAGVITTNTESPIPTPGTRVKAGDLILTLVPLLSPERDVPTPAELVQMAGARATLVAAQVTAQGDVQRGRAEVTATKIALDRAVKLFADRAGSQRAVDDTQAQANVAETVLVAANERFAQLTKLLTTLESDPGHEPATSITLRAPVDGVIRSVNISAGQQVVGGAALFEVLDTRVVWIRVPVFVDLLTSIKPNSTGQVVTLNGKPLTGLSQTTDLERDSAIPIDAPPTADAASSSADLYFEVSNQSLNLRPGQRVGIELPLNVKSDSIVVPAASILYDIYGGTWVYVLKAEHRFERQRVSVRWFAGADAILENGPKVGTLVVADGAAELFGTEFGPGK